MHRALRRAWWALAAAVGLALVLPTRTLSAAHPVAHSGERAVQKSEVETTHAAAAEATRVTEIEVELAWLADPITFPYHLGARVAGGALHVRGFVQSKAGHDHALQVARDHCALQVIDELKIHPSMVIVGMASATAPVLSEAEAALAKSFPRQASSFLVACRADGQLGVVGTVPSIEEKWAVSQRLRQVPGCAAVLNQLRVGPAPATAAAPRPAVGQEQTASPGTITLDRVAENWVPTTQWQTSDNIPLAPLPEGPAPIPDPMVQTASARELVQQPEPGPIVTTLSEDKGGVAVTRTQPEPAVVKTAPQSAAGRPLVPNAPLLARLKARIESVCGSGAMELRLVPQTGKNLLVEFKARDDAEAARLAEKILTMPELAKYHVDLDAKVAEPPASPPPLARIPGTRSAPPPATPPHVPAAVARDQAQASPYSPLPEIRLEAPSAGPIWMPARGPQSVLQSDSARARNDQAQNGVVKVAQESPKTKSPPALPPAPPSPGRLQERVAAVCGSGASDVHLAVRSPSNVFVQFAARNEAEAERLATTVMAMPELSAYHVDLDVKLAEAPATAARPPAPFPLGRTGTLPVVARGPSQARPDTLRVADPPPPPPAVSPVVWHATPSPMAPAATISASAPAARAPGVVAATAPPKKTSETANGPGTYATTGVAVVSESAPAFGPQPSALFAAHLQERVESACGSRAEVHVLARPAGTFLVQFKARDAADAERLTGTILSLAELRPYKVDLDVKLAQ